jgi:very-short-patch-repair endonuclease
MSSREVKPASETTQYVLDSIHALRQKLLDVSLRNPLISFKHAGRSARHVRVIDELPDQLFEKLNGEGAMTFRSLGVEETIPQDEKTIPFQRALDAAKLNDPEYLAALRELGEEPGEKALQRLETELRVRLRERLGMPARRQKAGLTPQEVAEKQGLDPSFDLPAISAVPPEKRLGKHSDSVIQTLLFAETMDRVLFNIRENVRLSIDETGVNPLFCVFGFLEWYEDTNSEVPLHAPLLMLPLQIQRELVRGTYQYRVRGAGDGAMVNVAMAERLKRDFDITLPALGEEETPEAYFARVQCAVEPVKGWKVRRWVTVGLFSFARIAMYHDLDPAHWAAAGGVENHPKVLRLLAGLNAEPKEYGRENPGEAPSPVDDLSEDIPLIADADSSQLRAIKDALDRRDLVVEGPPGTGKSQTITNLIAAALAKGKTVLFLAEKMAALSVVKDRLAHAGLDEFCLELHSTKAGRKETVDKLGKRLSREAPKTVEAELQATLKHLNQTKEHLQRGVEELAKPAGRLSYTVQELLWRCHQARERTRGVPSDVDEITFPNALELTETDLERVTAVARQFEANREKIREQYGSVQQQPWLGIARGDLDPVTAEDVVRRVSRLHQAATPVAALAARLRELTGCDCATAAELRPLANVPNLPAPPAGGDRLVAPLIQPQTLSAIRQFVQDLDSYVKLRNEAATAFAEPGDVEQCQPELLKKVAEKVEPLGLQDKTAAEVKAQVERRRREIEEWDAIAALLKEMASFAGWQETMTAEGERLLVAAVELAAQADASLLALRKPEYLQPGVATLLEARAQQTARLRPQAEALRGKYVLELKPDPAALRRDAAALRSAPFLPFLSPGWWRARKTFLGLCRAPGKPGRHEMAAALDEIAGHLTEVAAFEQDQELAKLLGASFKGLDTDLEPTRRVAAWMEQVRTRVTTFSPIGNHLRLLLIEGAAERVLALGALAGHGRLANLKKAHATDPGMRRGVLEFAGIARSRLEGTLEVDALLGQIRPALGWKAGQSRALASDLARLDDLRTAVEQSAAARKVLGDAFLGTRTDVRGMVAALVYVEAVYRSPLAARVKTWMCERDVTPRYAELVALAKEIISGLKVLDGAVQELVSITKVDWPRWLKAATPDAVKLDDLAAYTVRCAMDPEGLHLLVDDERLLADAQEAGIGPVMAWTERAKWTGRGLADICRRVCYQSLARDAIARSPVLAQFTGDRYQGHRERFRDLDRKLIGLRQQKIATDLLRRPVDEGNESGPRSTWTNLALVRNEVTKQRQHIAVRALLDRASAAIQQLMPCFMMSPLSVAQYLKPGALKFDLVVMDEASQLRPEDAIGAVARSGQVVIVGDPKQLPPTSFFMSGEVVPGDEEQETVAHEQSILDAALSVMSPARRLKWHYRSRHASLIAFSNREFYDSELVIFPTPHAADDDYGIRYHHLPDAVYGDGVNPVEARTVAERCVEYALAQPERSLGVVTLNQKQSELVKLEIDRLAAENPSFEAWRKRREETLEPFFVKNLENVQGDERDTIVISTVYGKDAQGNLFQRFGPINAQGGHRRLNVLFTRAKCQILVYSSLDPSDLRVDEKSSWGLRALKGFLQFARGGSFDGAAPTGREPDSEFEVAVAKVLKDAGLEVVPQVGVRGYFIDLAVVNPKKPGEYLLGVECDGAAYHSGKSVRDRDRLRQEILERLNWRIHRVWSLDWYRNPKREQEKLLKRVREVLDVAS